MQHIVYQHIFTDIIMISNALKITLLSLTCSLSLQATIMSRATLKLADASIPAEHVKKGQLVNSLNRDKNTAVKALVLSATPSKTKSIVEIDLGDRKIQASANQTYYDPVLNKWIPANKLTPKNTLLSEDMTHKRVLGAQIRTGNFDAMKISVNGSHYIFADGVLTHNYFGIVFIPLFILAMATSKPNKNRSVSGSSVSGSNAAQDGKRMVADHKTK